MKHRNTKHTFCSKVRINEIKAPIKVEELLFSIGSLGGGNHFIEVDKDTNGDFYIVIHSGSRHLGIEVCKYYQNKAINFHKNNCEEQSKFIAKLKSEGREKEIQTELSKIKKESIPNELAYLIGDSLEDYLRDMELVHAFILESGLSECCAWAENEELVDWIARQFPKMNKVFTEIGVDK